MDLKLNRVFAIVPDRKKSKKNQYGEVAFEKYFIQLPMEGGISLLVVNGKQDQNEKDHIG